MTKMKMRAKETVGELEDDGDTLETMEALQRQWRHFGDNGGATGDNGGATGDDGNTQRRWR